MKKIIKSFICIMLLTFSIKEVKATENYFINENGVKISYDFVEKTKDIIPMSYFDTITQEKYNTYVKLYSGDYEVVTQYEVTDYLVKNGEVLSSESTIMSKDEFEEYSSTMIEPYYSCAGDDVCHETGAKVFSMVTVNTGYETASYTSVYWKSIPTVKSYDVLAVMWDQNLSLKSTAAEQYAVVNGKGKTTTYNTSSGSNTKRFSNGIGVSMNLYDDATSELYLTLNVVSSPYGSPVTFRASYQHAVRSVSLDTSKSYTLSTSGLGGVIKFNTNTIKSYYDGMQGIVYTAPYGHVGG